jgi:hypothetical protein
MGFCMIRDARRRMREEESHKLVNQQQFYVSISRARYDAQVFTYDLKTLERPVGKDQKKSVAMEVVKPAPPTTELRPAQALNYGTQAADNRELRISAMKKQRILRLQSRRATERIVIPACRPAPRSVVRLRRISFFRSLFNQREKFDAPGGSRR